VLVAHLFLPSSLMLPVPQVSVCEWQLGHNHLTFSRRLSLLFPLM